LPGAAEVLHAAYLNADPPFTRDAAACASTENGNLVGYVGDKKVCAELLIDQAGDHTGVASGSVTEVQLLTSRPGAKTLHHHISRNSAAGAVSLMRTSLRLSRFS
jgi:hypothetical protein